MADRGICIAVETRRMMQGRRQGARSS